MAQITQFGLDANWDLQPALILTDLQAVAQIIGQRLRLLLQEWWEAQQLGLPLWTGIIGSGRNTQAASLLIQQNILGAPYVTGISNLQVSFSQQQIFKFSCTAHTPFGPITVSNSPTPGGSTSTGQVFVDGVYVGSGVVSVDGSPTGSESVFTFNGD
jgi:hypothetical protein